MTTEAMTKEELLGNCPKCGKSWDGGPIPENMREHYSPPYRCLRRNVMRTAEGEKS